MISKAQAIRNVVHDDMSMTHPQIKEAVLKRYGLRVGTNEIIKQVGRYEDRRFKGKVGRLRLKLAKEFVSKVGDINEAVRLCHLSQVRVDS